MYSSKVYKERPNPKEVQIKFMIPYILYIKGYLLRSEKYLLTVASSWSEYRFRKKHGGYLKRINEYVLLNY